MLFLNVVFKFFEILYNFKDYLKLSKSGKKNFTFLWACFITFIVLWLSVVQLNLFKIVRNMTTFYQITEKNQAVNNAIISVVRGIQSETNGKGRFAIEYVPVKAENKDQNTGYIGTIGAMYAYNPHFPVLGVDNSMSRDLKYHPERIETQYRTFPLGKYEPRMKEVSIAAKFEGHTIASLSALDEETTQRMFITETALENPQTGEKQTYYGNIAFKVHYAYIAPFTNGETVNGTPVLTHYTILMLDKDAYDALNGAYKYGDIMANLSENINSILTNNN